MPKRKYADTDFFLALMKSSDWLKERARNIYSNNKGNIIVTPFTIAEIMIVCRREGIPIKRTIHQISRIAILEGMKWETFVRACDFIDEGATIFDSLLMASCNADDEIISSDNMYEKFGFKIIDLKER